MAKNTKELITTNLKAKFTFLLNNLNRKHHGILYRFSIH